MRLIKLYIFKIMHIKLINEIGSYFKLKVYYDFYNVWEGLAGGGEVRGCGEGEEREKRFMILCLCLLL